MPATMVVEMWPMRCALASTRIGQVPPGSYGGEGALLSLAGVGELQGGGLAVGLQVLRYGTEADLPVARDARSVVLTPGSVGVSVQTG